MEKSKFFGVCFFPYYESGKCAILLLEYLNLKRQDKEIEKWMKD